MKAGIDYIGVGLGAIILNEKSEVLLMKRGPKCYNEIGSWALPGGKLDFGETLEQGIIREVLEELNIIIANTKHLTSYDHILPEEKQHWVTNVFLAHNANGTPEIMEHDKCSEIAWFDMHVLPQPIAKMSKPALQYLIDNNSQYEKLAI